MAAGDLVLLTDEYPFGSQSETYLEGEMPLLADRFRKIYVLPSHVQPGIRPLPANAELVQLPWYEEPPRRERARALMSSTAARALIGSLGTRREMWAYRRAAKLYVDILSRELLALRHLRDFTRRHRLFDATFYDYWFHNATLALALYRQTGEIRTAVARAHRFDIFDEAWGGLPVPFRQAKALGLDMVYPTSQAGADYLRARVPALRSKLQVHRLGAVDPGRTSPEPRDGDPPLVLTCARLTEVKRIDRVPSILARVGEPIHWVHIGDGPERAAVEAAAARQLPAGAWELLGKVANHAVLDFYGRNSVQALLSVASSEGLPVSMMEAVSFGVPVVSCDVGGIAELVNERTGVLIDRDASDATIADALRGCLHDPTLTRGTVRAEYLRGYDAGANYAAFADALLELRARTVPPMRIGRTAQ